MNQMRQIKIEKVTLNIGVGKDQSRLESAMSLLQSITGKKPVNTFTSKRIQEWGLRPGLPIGCKVTLRKEVAKAMLKKLLEAKENSLTGNNFDDNGNISFGIHEYIDIEGVKYDPKIGIMGLEVCTTLERSGFRVKRRSFMKRKVPPRHKISKDAAMDFLKTEFGVKIGEE